MKVLVTGGTGTVGSHVVRELANRGAEVSVLTRNPAKTKNLPAAIRAIEGDLMKPSTVRQVFKGFDGVFLLNALSTTEAHEGLQAVCGMRLSGVKRVVYQSVTAVDRASHLPHFGAKLAIEHAVRHSGIPFTILRPNHFFQNDYLLKDAMLQAGLYPQPLGNIGVSRVDVRDIAEAAATAMLSADHEGETYELAGPDALTGPTCAEIWSNALGRNVKFAADDLNAWEQQSLQYLPDWLVFDVRLMFDYFHKHGLKVTDEEMARQTRLVGHPPRTFDAFARETAAMWRG